VVDVGRNTRTWYSGNDSLATLDGEYFPRLNVDDKLNLKSNSLSKNKAELFYKFFKSYGKDFLNAIKGWFNVVILDHLTGELLILNDRLGYKPFYYYHNGETFLFSTRLKSLTSHPKIHFEFNNSYIADYAFFNYPIGDKTPFQNVYRLPPASLWKYNVHTGKLTKDSYWDISEIFQFKPIDDEKCLQIAPELFNGVVNDLTKDKKDISLTLTGGFDGRTILSAIDPQNTNIWAFTFGVHGAENMLIAKRICRKLKLRHHGIKLEDEYFSVFPEYAKRVVSLSDGMSTVLRAHYLYAFEKQAEIANTFLTGIGGSELIRPVHNTGEVFHEHLKSIFLSEEPGATVENILNESDCLGLFSKQSLKDFKYDIWTSIIEKFFDKYKHYSSEEKFFIFLLTEVFRKYFGTEMAIENQVGTVRAPFLDYDFITFIVRTSWSCLRNPLFKNSPIARRRSQIFHSQVINHNSTILSLTWTDRGYPPILNILPFPYAFIAPLYVANRLKRRASKKKAKSDFNFDQWMPCLVKGILEDPSIQNRDIFEIKKARKQFDTRSSGDSWLDLAKLISFELFLRDIGEN
jgi:asparagine synthetase B (glutamine-hydrolysing)